MTGIEIVTFGCRVNTFESEIMRRQAEEAGLTDAVIVNTCAVTAEAERQARQTIRRLRRERPGARIIVTGCAAQIGPARFADMPEVDKVLGNAEKLRLESYAEQEIRVLVGDIMTVRETAPQFVGGFEGRVRAFVQVQQGCDHRCTFCIIPFGRGNSRSVPAAQVVTQIRALVEAGYREVVLTGVDAASYGGDLSGHPRLGQLARQVLKEVPELSRLRLSSLDPVAIDADLWRLLAEEPRLMPHFHLSLQAGDDVVLKRMKRRHLRADALAICRRAQDLRPGIALGADFIAGFPTETEDAFRNTLSLIEECGLVHLHIFPYSPRTGTPAARMPQVEAAEIRERAAQLREASRGIFAGFLQEHIGLRVPVLAERGGIGHTEDYAPVRLVQPYEVGSLFLAEVTGATQEHLLV